MNGKHINMRKSSKSGYLWHNKRYFSIEFFYLCDARYCFSLVDVAGYGSNSDKRILINSKMEKRFGNGQMSIPEYVDEVILESVNQDSGDDLELP